MAGSNSDSNGAHACQVFEAILGAIEDDGGPMAVTSFLQNHWPLPKNPASLVSRLKAKRLWLNAPDYTNFNWAAAPPPDPATGKLPVPEDA